MPFRNARARVLGAILLITAAVGTAQLAGTGAARATAVDRGGWFVCHALPWTEPRMPPPYVDKPTECIPMQHSSASEPVGSIGTISVATSRQSADPSGPYVAPPAVGDGGRAETSLTDVTLLTGTDTPITVATSESSADARCVSLGPVPTLVGTSRVVGARIRGLDLPDVITGDRRYDLPNGLGTVEFNRQTVYSWTEGVRTYTVLRQDAIVLTLRTPVRVGSLPFGLSGGGTVTTGTTTAGYYGNPCGP